MPSPPDFDLQLTWVGSFSDRRAPRVIWAGVLAGPIDESELGKLAERVDVWLASAGFPRERRGFRPHLTLARLPEKLTAAERELVAATTTKQALPAVETYRVRGVSLMRSHLGRDGARYERLALYPEGAEGAFTEA